MAEPASLGQLDRNTAAGVYYERAGQGDLYACGCGTESPVVVLSQSKQQWGLLHPDGGVDAHCPGCSAKVNPAAGFGDG